MEEKNFREIISRFFHLPLTDQQILTGMMFSLAAAVALVIVTYVLYDRTEWAAKNERLWQPIRSMVNIALYYNLFCLFAWLLALKKLIPQITAAQITAAAFTAILSAFGVLILLDKLIDFITVKRQLSKKAK